MGESQLGKHPGHRHVACSMERSVDDADLILHLLYDLLVDDGILHMGDVFIIDLLAYGDIESCCLSLFPGHGPCLGEVLYGKDLLGNSLVMRRRELSAVLPVYLVSVIIRGIVAGSDIDAGYAVKLPDCKAELRCGPQGLKAICLYAIGSQSTGSLIGKLL